MIHLCYSNRTEELLAALVRNVERERAEGRPFQPVRLVVPNRNVETYVKLGLAQAAGIAANLKVGFLRRLVVDVAAAVAPGVPVVDARQTEGHLLALLHDEAFLAGEALAPVREYLEGGGASPDAVDRRRAQLAAELAHLYDEYASSRADLLSRWREGPTLANAPAWAATEAWQRALWLKVFASGEVRLTLPGIVRAVESTPPPPGPPLHLFGVSYVARGYHALLAALARTGDVRVYTLNPCREFWEDLETVGEASRRGRRGRKLPSRSDVRQPVLAIDDDPFELTRDTENLALRLWGRPGRENVRLLNELTEGDFEARFVPHAGPRTLLRRVQDDVLDRAVPAASAATARADGSLRILPCPGLRRELETVAAEIWRLLRDDPSLRLNDIAVIVPESRKDAYLAHVPAVFAEAHGLPHSLTDVPAGGGRRLGEAIERLLELPLSSFTRRELLPLLTHPAVMGRFPDAQALDWIRLCDELGVVHGADSGDHRGTYIQRDLYNWDQGVRRLALGALMTGPASGDDTPVRFGGHDYLPTERPADEEPAALGFALLVRSLLADARFAAGLTGPRTRPLPEWIELIRGMLTGYLVPQDEDDEALLARCLRELDELETLPLGDTRISFRIAAELARNAFAAVGSGLGQYLAHGVTVASFVPMRAIPFRAVFVLGLGQGQFPSARRRSALDLREARRVPGDVSPREQDLYMFLETMLCARDTLVLSYVARDELTGEPLAPSSVLLELRELLSSYLPAAELTALFAGPPPPLRRYDDEDRLEALPVARSERATKALGLSLREALPAGAAPPDLPALRRALPPDRYAAVARRLGVVEPPAIAQGTTADRLVVSLAALRQFLEDPLQGSARFRLRMRELDDDEAAIDREDEPFATAGGARTMLLRRAMIQALTGADRSWPAVVAAYRRLAEREELSGGAPTGLFLAAERQGHEALLRAWLSVVETMGATEAARVVRFGRAAEHDDAAEILPGIPLAVPLPSGGTVAVELVGRTELIVPAQTPASVVFTMRKKVDEGRLARDRLRGFVDHVALSAAGLSAGKHAAAIANANRTPKAYATSFAPVDADSARQYLADVIADMLTGVRDAAGTATGVHAYLLPCEAVFASRTKKTPIVDEVEQLRDGYFDANIPFSSVYGPVPQAVERHQPPAADDADAMARRRFGLYFDVVESDR